MRFMQINSVSNILSTGRTAMELADAFAQYGDDTSIVFSEGICNEKDFFWMKNPIDKKIHALLSRITGLVGYFSFFETIKLLRYIREWKPDVVRLANLHSNFINIPMLLKYLGRNNIATIITLDDCFWFTGKCCHYTITGCDKWKSVCEKCPRVHIDNKSWFFDRTEKMQKDKKQAFSRIKQIAIVGVSQWIADEARKSNIFKSTSNIVSIYNWIDTEKFVFKENSRKTDLGLDNQKIVLGVSTYWSETKGINDFIRIAQVLPRICFLLVGDFRNDMKLPPNIITIGKTHDVNELIEYYSMADVFFNPSVEESFGKVTAEALSCGTPVVVYNTTACPELVGNNCGCVVPLGDITQAAKVIQDIISNGRLYYSENCRRFAEHNFNKEKCIHQYHDLALGLLDGGN